MEEKDSLEGNEGARYRQTKTARCVMRRGEVVKSGCNGKGYFNILLYGYWCQYCLEQGEREGGGKGRVFVKKANKWRHVHIPSPFVRENKDASGRCCWWCRGNRGGRQVCGVARLTAAEPQTHALPAAGMRARQLLLGGRQSRSFPSPGLELRWEKGTPQRMGCLETSHGTANPSHCFCLRFR